MATEKPSQNLLAGFLVVVCVLGGLAVWQRFGPGEGFVFVGQFLAWMDGLTGWFGFTVWLCTWFLVGAVLLILLRGIRRALTGRFKRPR